MSDITAGLIYHHLTEMTVQGLLFYVNYYFSIVVAGK